MVGVRSIVAAAALGAASAHSTGLVYEGCAPNVVGIAAGTFHGVLTFPENVTEATPYPSGANYTVLMTDAAGNLVSQYNPSTTYTVTITEVNSVPFKGFVIGSFAQLPPNNDMGLAIPRGNISGVGGELGKPMGSTEDGGCDNGWTHVGPSAKQSINFAWTSPTAVTLGGTWFFGALVSGTWPSTFDDFYSYFVPEGQQTATPVATQTPVGTQTPSSAVTVSPEPTATKTGTSAATETPVETATPVETRSPMATATTTRTGTGAETPTRSGTPLSTETRTSSASPSRTATSSPSSSPSDTSSLSATTTETGSPSPSQTGSPSPSETSSETPTTTVTPTTTQTKVSKTRTGTKTGTRTRTSSKTGTKTRSSTRTGTRTRTGSKTPTRTRTGSKGRPAL